jgi:hypothetical protein
MRGAQSFALASDEGIGAQFYRMHHVNPASLTGLQHGVNRTNTVAA